MSEPTRNETALVVLEEVLLAARRSAEQAQREHGQFALGLKTAYYDVLTVALEQADLLGLARADLGLKDFNPDALLRDKVA